MTSNVTEYYDELNNYNSSSEATNGEALYLNIIRDQYVITYVIICFFGVILNFYVIIASCCVHHRVQKSATSVCVQALALTHLIFSAFLVLQLFYAWFYFNWHYGEMLCKLSSYVFYISMFSTATLLSLWSISSSISSSRCSGGFCAKCGSVGTTVTLALSSWTFGVILSSPSLLSRKLRYTKLGQQCIDDYDSEEDKTTNVGVKTLTAVLLSRFLLGVLIPMFMMVISSSLGGRQGNMHQSCKRVIFWIKVAYFVCWTPLLFLQLVQIPALSYDFFQYVLPAATVLAAAHCFINPAIYLLVGDKINMQWMS